MGQSKLLLPWGQTTVLGQTLSNLQASAVHDIQVVSGFEAEAMEVIAAQRDMSVIHNPDYVQGEMLSSLQAAVAQLPRNRAAVLVMLADQPMIEAQVLDRLLAAYWRGHGELIAPSYKGQRGNPVLIGRSYFPQLLALLQGSAPRELLQRYEDDLYLVEVESEAILHDIDRPDDYLRWRPAGTPNFD
jgi:molybdenum cofactor cytidylyltransferase